MYAQLASENGGLQMPPKFLKSSTSIGHEYVGFNVYLIHTVGGVGCEI
jgi:hypothetical protein